jgi:coproporphyrinogen III oxidase-like Fe-S oxidoreductase
MVVDHEAPDEARHTSEALMLGLRLMEGIGAQLETRAVELVPARAEVFAKAIGDGYLLRDATTGRLRLTAAGSLLANEVLSALI